MEEGENPRSRGMPRPCAYALGDTAQSKRIQFHGVSQREEQSNDLRKVPGIEIQVSEQGVLVPWVLRRHGRENAKKIEEYIRHQLEEDKAGEQLTMGNF